MQRLTVVLIVGMLWTLAARSQESEEEANPGRVQFNAISRLLLEQPPQLQPNYLSDGDKWLLYSPQFDALSAAGQQFLLEKYGYLSSPAAGFVTARKTPFLPSEPVIAPLAPGVNVKVTLSDAETRRRLQSEACIAVSGQNIVVGYNDFGVFERVSYSRDGGTTWRQSQLPGFPGFTVNAGDPVVAAGPDGRFYHAYLAPTVFGLLSVAVSRSDDGGATWSAPSNATATVASPESDPDKDWMAVDNVSGSPYRGNVYVSWTMFEPDAMSIQLVRSTNGGRTWSSAVTVTALSEDDLVRENFVQFSYLAVGPNGEVYVSWYDTRVHGIRVRKSVNGGATFSNPVTALAPFEFQFASTGHFDLSPVSALAVDTGSGPFRGTVYLTAHILTSPANNDVVVVRSTDGGLNWSAAVRVNHEANNDQFMPDIAVAENGNVGIIFYDRRNDPENNSLVDLYIGISSDGGRTFPINNRVTTTNWPVLPTPLGARPGYHGDYNKVTASGNNFYMAWGDDRSGLDPDVYVAVVPGTGALRDFVLASTKAWADVLPGGSATYTLTTGGATVLRFTATATAPGLSFQFSGNTLTVSTTPSTSPGTYTIQVTGVAESLERATVVRLTVHSPQLPRLPIAVTPVRVPAYAADAATDAAGNVHMIAVEETVSRVRKRITYRRLPAGKTEADPPQTVFRADTAYREQTIADVRIAAEATGKVYVVWQRADRFGSDIMLSSSADGRTFSAPLDVSQVDPFLFALQPGVAVARDGTVFVSYIRERLQPFFGGFALAAADLFLVRSSDGGRTFSAPVNVSRYTGTARFVLATASPSLALDAADQPHLAWVGLTLPPLAPARFQDVYYASSRDGGLNFGAVANASRGTRPTVAPTHPSLAVDARNNIYVLWTNPDLEINQQDILLSKSADGVRFETISNLSSASFWSGERADWPSLVVDGAGNLTAAWRQLVTNPLKLSDPERDMFFSRSRDGGLNWSPPVNMTTNLGDTLLGSSTSFTPEPIGMTVDGTGRVFIVWDDDTSGGSQILLMQLP